MPLTKYNLGQLLELVEETNNDLKYGADDVRGVTISKQIIPTKADVSATDLSKFIVVNPNEFVFNPRTHGKKIGFGYNNTNSTFIISWNNIAFRIKKSMKTVILSEYLFLHFNRGEWDREACFRSWGSSTEVFSWDSLCDMELDLPSVEIQKKYVDIYNAMVKNQQCYERGIEDLKLVCDAYIEKLRREISCCNIGSYIAECTERNSNLVINNVQGVNNNNNFIETRANIIGIDLQNYKIVRKGQFAYNPSRINLGSIALLSDDDCIVSPMYIVFKVVYTNILLPEYLMMWLSRSEFYRSTLFYASGSVRDTFDFNIMKEVKIPIPKLKIQEDIVNIYSAYQLRKEINKNLKEQIRNICPILIKGSIDEGKAERRE